MSSALATFAFAPVLLADWISTTIWLVVISIGTINQVMGERKKNAAKRAPPPAEGAKPAPGGKGLLDEVERFLQEARKATEQAQNRPAQQQPRQVAAAPQQQKPRRTPQQQREQQQRAAQKKQQRGGPAKRVSQEDLRREAGALAPRQLGSKLELSSEEETFRGTVSEHVSQHLDTSRFAERAGRLSHIQQTVEADIGGHVRSVFDHQVGTLSQSGAPRDPNEVIPLESIGTLDQIALMLRDPQSMRAAFIMQEVLRPPTERWS